MKFLIHRAVSVVTGEPIDHEAGEWHMVMPRVDQDFDALVSYYQNMNTEPDPMRREVRVFETPDDVYWVGIKAATD